MTIAIPTQIEKCKGAMLATAIGDALGWPNEPRSKNRIKRPKVTDHFVEWIRSSSNPRWHDERILPGEYSDDTQMTLSVARSIIAGDWENFLIERELPFWLTYERGGGGALLKAAKSYSMGDMQLWRSKYALAYFNAGGNGAAMRILPHVIATAKRPNIDALMLDVARDTLITHGHPRAFLGATCYAYALEYLLRKNTILEYGELVSAVIDGQNNWGAFLDPDIFGDWLHVVSSQCGYNFSAEWERTRIHMVKQLEFISVSLNKGLILDDIKVLTELECFGTANGAGDIAALAAIYLASRYANNPSVGIKIPAFSFGADTDTIASMTGGLVGMLSGTSWIPSEWKLVQDYNCLLQLTELLLADNKKEAAKTEVAEVNVQDDSWIATPIGKMRLIDLIKVPNGKHGMVIIRKWQTMLGQTLYTKEFQANDPDSHPRQSDEQAQLPQQLTLYDLSESPSLKLVPPAPMHENTPRQMDLQKASGQFILDANSVLALLSNSQLKKNITIGKTLKIILALIEGNKSNAAIAKQLEVDQAMVNVLRHFVK